MLQIAQVLFSVLCSVFLLTFVKTPQRFLFAIRFGSDEIGFARFENLFVPWFLLHARQKVKKFWHKSLSERVSAFFVRKLASYTSDNLIETIFACSLGNISKSYQKPISLRSSNNKPKHLKWKWIVIGFQKQHQHSLSAGAQLSFQQRKPHTHIIPRLSKCHVASSEKALCKVQTRIKGAADFSRHGNPVIRKTYFHFK